jgi:hypothetical protein
MRRAALLLSIACVPIVVFAQASRSDFVRGADIQIDGAGSLFRILLPDDVYDTSTRADLADLRVLNAAGETVPHTLREVPRPKAREAEWIGVPSFPMTTTLSGAAARTHVKVGADGTVLEVTNDRTPGQSTTAYLIDASAIMEPLARIDLMWDAAPGATFLVPVSVVASDDLNAWRTVVASSAIAQLQRESFTLMQNAIDLPSDGVRAKYLRISWPRELAAVTVKSARVRPRPATAAPDLRWRTLDAERIDPPNVAYYDTRGFLPIEYLDIDFAEAADATSVTIRSRPDSTATFTVRHSGLFYTLQGPAGAIRSSYAPIDRTPDRYWSVETKREGGWKQNRAPRLKVGWHPHELLFVARGTPPYVLAYGSARVGPADAPVDQLLVSLNRAGHETAAIPLATIGAPHSLGGADALKPAPATLPWKRIALWGVLIVAVGFLAILALRLFRDTTEKAG